MSIEELIKEERKSIKKIEESKIEAEKKIADAQKEAKKIMDKATKKEYVQEYIENEEKKVKVEAKKIVDKYKKEMPRIRKVPPNKVQKVMAVILDEVLKFE